MTLLRHLPRFRQAYRELPVLEAREGWSRAEIEAFQFDRLNPLWAHAVAHVPYYRELAARLGLPEKFRDLAEYQATVPVTPREAVRARPRDFLSERAGPGNWRLTSGSTGVPLNVYWPHDAARETLRYRYRLLARWGVDFLDRQAMLWGDGAAVLQGPARVLAVARRRATDWLRNRVRLSAFRLRPADLRAHLRRLVAARPVSLYAYSSAALVLARAAEAAGVRLPSMRVAVLSAEPAPPPLVAAVERGFGAPAVNEYGSIECGPMAFEGPDRVLRVREDGVLVETPRRPDGRHDIVTTALHNRAFPLFRYAIGDVTDAPLVTPERGFAALTSVTGRANDTLVTGAGRPLSWARLDYTLAYVPRVRRYHAHQREDGSVLVRLEPADPVAPPDPAPVRREVAELLDGYPVEVAVVGAIPPGPNGKHRWIVSDLAARG